MPNDPLVLTPLRRARRREAGSAYLLALLVLVVLSLVGLSLALVTQTEQQIGATEREAARALYAADSGTAVSLAFAMQYDRRSRRLLLNRLQTGDLVTADRVQMSPFAQISKGPCNLCMINQGRIIYQTNNAVTAWESRQNRPASAADTAPWSGELSAKLVGVLIGIQPTDLTIDEAQQRVNDPVTNDLIRY